MQKQALIRNPRRTLAAAVTYGFHDSAAGPLLIAVSEGALCWLGLRANLSQSDLVAKMQKSCKGASFRRDDSATSPMAREISAWLAGKRATLSAPLLLSGTPFQIKVWETLLTIPRGRTLTYKDVAEKIGKPDAARAVGSATGANPVSLIVPCHRVLGAGKGSRLKYGWGPKAKRRLLEMEGVSDF